MRVYQFTVPSGKTSETFEENLAGAFGGFTKTEGSGAWYNPQSEKLELEAVCVYTVAVPESATGRSDFRWFVIRHLRRMGEQAAFLAEIGTAEVIALR